MVVFVCAWSFCSLASLIVAVQSHKAHKLIILRGMTAKLFTGSKHEQLSACPVCVSRKERSLDVKGRMCSRRGELGVRPYREGAHLMKNNS